MKRDSKKELEEEIHKAAANLKKGLLFCGKN